MYKRQIKSLTSKSQKNLASGFTLNLDREEYDLSGGMTVYETLSGSSSDRYQYVFPYYSFSKVLEYNKLDGTFSFSNGGSNSLSNTNTLESSISNGLTYSSKNYFSDNGFQNNFGIHFNNPNVVRKNHPSFKSSVQSELMNLIELNSSFPLIKLEDDAIFSSIIP